MLWYKGYISEQISAKEINLSSVDYDLLNSIQYVDILEYLTYGANELGYNAATRSKHISAIDQYYKYMERHDDLVVNNPTADLSTPKQPKREPIYLNEEEALKLLNVVGNDIAGLAFQLKGHRGLLHVNVDGSCSSQVVDDEDIKLLSPTESTSVRVCLRYYQLSVSIGCVDMRHTFLFHPYLTELTYTGCRCLLVEGVDKVFPRGILEVVLTQISPETVLQVHGSHRLLQHTHPHWCFVVDDIVVEQGGVIQVL